jgi:hypothetical protein
MSGVAKAVGKVFKAVVKVVRKVAPVVLAAAAIYFTAGAALGVSGAAGGWGAAAASMTSSMGATGTLGSVLTGAITQAGYGAAMGGVTSLLTGQDPMKGMQAGALGGAITGGISGGLGLPTDPLKGIGESGGAAVADGAGADAAASGMTRDGWTAGGQAGMAANTSATALDSAYAPTESAVGAAQAAGPAAGYIPPMQAQSLTAPSILTAEVGQPAAFGSSDVLLGGASNDALAGSMIPGGQLGAPADPSATALQSKFLPTTNAASAGTAVGPASDGGLFGKGGLLGQGGWIERNGQLVGQTVSGIGQGLLRAGAMSDGEARLRAYQEQNAAITNNYRSDGRGLLSGQAPQTPQGAAAPPQAGQYVFDPSTGRYVFVPARRA